MEITRQADYAVRAVLELALRPAGKLVRAEEIARCQAIPPAFLPKILARLVVAGIVETQRGVKGGVRLTRPAGEVSLLEVVEAVDGPILLNRCLRAPGECPRDTHCVVHPVWESLREEVRARLRDETLAVLAKRATTAGPSPTESVSAPHAAPAANAFARDAEGVHPSRRH
ncbi:MAG: Rrf2 family transcriptional regulator [Armatimonadota bacterium]|nr:Rrf2 family transcriptional regulator [Armatimonadota bacterium]